jgi:hypothetical protein
MQADTRQPGATVPLLRSIAREIRERNQSIADLEARSAQLASDPQPSRDELRVVQRELALHVRELRRAEKELERLGWSLDPDHALRLLRANSGGAARESWRPEDTGFYRIAANTHV